MKEKARYVLVLFFIVAGINHFLHPRFYLDIMPPWVPYHLLTVYISGLCEVVFGSLLLYPATRRVGAWLIILLLIAIFPANIQMAINFAHSHSPYLWLAIARLPLQLLLVWWVWVYTR